MENIIIVEGKEKYCFSSIKEAVKQFLGQDFYELKEEKKYERLKRKTIMNSIFRNIPIKDLKKGEIVEDVTEEQYIIYDEEIFLLSLAKNNDIVIYEKENVNILARNINKENLERISKTYIIINECVNEILENKLKSINKN